MKSKSRRREWKDENEIHTAVTSSSAQPSPPWIELPGDITFNILQRLGAAEMLESAQNVCATWRRVCQDPVRWRVVDLKNPGGSQLRGKFGVLCRQAVNYSQGQLVDLSIDNFGDDELLNYIVDRSSNLRRLKLERSYWISGECLAEAVKKLPHLEELHLLYMFSVQVKDIETIGISCPTLKSFTFNERGDTCPSPGYPDDDELMVELGFSHYAPVIANTMPNLRHLRLFSHWIINEGLEAILDGCPRLELLDLRNCHGLDLLGDLGRRCGEQIPDLKHPSDPITETEWLVCNSSCTSYVEADQLSFSGVSDSHSFESNESDEDLEQYDDGISSDDDLSSEEFEHQERLGIWWEKGIYILVADKVVHTHANRVYPLLVLRISHALGTDFEVYISIKNIIQPNFHNPKKKMGIPAPPWIELPGDLTANIFGRLDAAEILESVQRVCTTWRKVCKDYPSIWRVISMKNVAGGLCRNAVDRSQGLLTELSLYSSGNNKLLNYVVDRSSNLRSLKLCKCYGMTAKCLVEAVIKLPRLEELHLVQMELFRAKDIEIIGISCPMLKSFTFNRPWFIFGNKVIQLMELDSGNAQALAIAKTMPNLRRLQLVGHLLNNEGLEAILDGCPQLESLNLLACSHVDGALAKRCFEQIKNLRWPDAHDSVDWSDSDDALELEMTYY